MMRDYNLLNNGFCSFGMGGYLDIWYYLILIVLIIIVAFIILRRKKKNNSKNSIELLKNMYVSGDLSEEEYIKRKAIIEKN